MILTNNTSTTTQKLQAFCDAAAATTNPTVTVVFQVKTRIQVETENLIPLAGNQFTVLSGVTETDVLAAPATGDIREILSVTVYNADTATRVVTICIDDNGTNRIQFKPQLSAARTWRYEKGAGVQII